MKTDTRFETFMGQLKDTNATLGFFSDFDKISQNVHDIEISLRLLNFLIGKQDLRGAVQALWKRDKRAFEVMGILIAIRDAAERNYVDEKGETQKVYTLFKSPVGVMTFLEETGLADVFRNREIKDLVDYVFGVETGLDSNARKNRSGTQMEELVASSFRSAGIQFAEQEYSANHPLVAQALGADSKRFDFVVKTKKKTYLMEVNFYSGGGSKLNETARSFTDIGPKINAIPGYEFVWITDGKGWFSAMKMLKEAFQVIPSIYNITTLGDFIARLKKS